MRSCRPRPSNTVTRSIRPPSTRHMLSWSAAQQWAQCAVRQRRSSKDKPGGGDDDASSGHGRATTRATLHDASAPQLRRDNGWLRMQRDNVSNTSVATNPRLRATACRLRSGRSQRQTIARVASANLDGVWQLDCTQGEASFPLVFYGIPNANCNLCLTSTCAGLGLHPCSHPSNGREIGSRSLNGCEPVVLLMVSP